MQRKHQSIGEVRGMGLMQGLELVKDRRTREPATDLAAAVLENARRNGLLIGKGGLYSNCLRVSPPLNVTRADVDEFLRKLDRSIPP